MVSIEAAYVAMFGRRNEELFGFLVETRSEVVKSVSKSVSKSV